MRISHRSSTALALHRVFIAPSIAQQPSLSQVSRLSTSLTTQWRPSPFPSLPLYLLFANGSRRCYAMINNNNNHKPVKSRLPRNEEITAYSVVLVDDDGKLTDARQTKALLEELDLKTHVLAMVAEG